MQLLRRNIEADEESQNDEKLQFSIASGKRLTIVLKSKDTKDKSKKLIRNDLILNLTRDETKQLKDFLGIVEL